MAVVEGLSKFEGDMGKIEDTIQKLVAPTNILGSAFGILGNILQGVGNFVVNTLAHAFGELLADAVQWATAQIKELIAGAIEAGGEFQKLALRLDTLNFNALTEEQQKFSNAQEIATNQTREQLQWLQKLANTTPYDNQDLSNVYTLARGYGFVDQEARSLVETTSDFAAGMGLGSTEITRMMKNFGQMQQLGKVMQRDLNDLATGAFVPVNDVLKMMQIETGLAGEEFVKFRGTAAGVDSFMRNFTAMVEGKFGGSAQKMARTFGAATDNAKDFVKSILGLNVVKPVLDVLGGHIADIMNTMNEPITIGGPSFNDEAVTVTTRFEQIVEIATRVGDSLSAIVRDVLGLAPSVHGLADGIVSGLDGIADWLDDHHDDIVGFAEKGAKWLREDLMPAIQQVWSFLFGSEGEPGAIQKFGAWLKDDFLPFIQREVLPGVKALFDAITGKKKEPDTRGVNEKDKGEGDEPTALENIVDVAGSLASTLPAILDLLGAIGGVITTAFGGDETKTFAEFINTTLIPALEGLKTFIDNNREALAGLLGFFIKLEILGFVVGLIFSVIAALAVLWFGIQTVMAILAAIGAPILTLIGLIILLAVIIYQNIDYIIIGWNYLKDSVVNWVTDMVKWFWIGADALGESFIAMYNTAKEWLGNLINTGKEKVLAFQKAFTDPDWGQIGRNIIEGIARGVAKAASGLIQAAVKAATDAVAAVQEALGVSSPSKVFMEIGEFTMKGMAIGIEKYAGLVEGALTNAMGASVLTPAMSAASTTVSTVIQNTNNFNQTINTKASHEPIIQDFGMLQSMVGA